MCFYFLVLSQVSRRHNFPSTFQDDGMRMKKKRREEAILSEGRKRQQEGK
jgi:hypothetical protein